MLALVGVVLEGIVVSTLHAAKDIGKVITPTVELSGQDLILHIIGIQIVAIGALGDHSPAELDAGAVVSSLHTVEVARCVLTDPHSYLVARETYARGIISQHLIGVVVGGLDCGGYLDSSSGRNILYGFYNHAVTQQLNLRQILS